MVKVLVVYDTRHGNTKTIASSIADGVLDSGVTDVVIRSVGEVDEGEFRDADGVLIGTPNHAGGPTRRVRKLIRDVSGSDLSGKTIGFFDTYMGGDLRKATAKMEAGLRKRSPDANIMSPGGSFRVDRMKGPLAEGEKEKAREFGKALASRIRR